MSEQVKAAWLKCKTYYKTNQKTRKTSNHKYQRILPNLSEVSVRKEGHKASQSNNSAIFVIQHATTSEHLAGHEVKKVVWPETSVGPGG